MRPATKEQRLAEERREEVGKEKNRRPSSSLFDKCSLEKKGPQPRQTHLNKDLCCDSHCEDLHHIIGSDWKKLGPETRKILRKSAKVVLVLSIITWTEIKKGNVSFFGCRAGFNSNF